MSPAADTEHIDLSERTTDPYRAVVLVAEQGHDVTAMVRVPMSSLRRSHLGVSIGDHNTNPFTHAVAEYLSWECTDDAGSTLRCFYESWQPPPTFGTAPGGTHGYDYFGPTSDALGEYRFNTHCLVAASIAEDGYDPSDHIIDAQLMAGEGSWALLARDGKHRTIGMAALGVDSVVVSLPSTYPVTR